MKNTIIEELQLCPGNGTDRPEVTDWVWPY